jgi:hypothetical protein
MRRLGGQNIMNVKGHPYADQSVKGKQGWKNPLTSASPYDKEKLPHRFLSMLCGPLVHRLPHAPLEHFNRRKAGDIPKVHTGHRLVGNGRDN